MSRVKTGIAGFDSLIEGGFIENSVNLVSGSTGTGKSIFGLQYLYNGIKQFNQRGVYITFEETPAELKEDAKTFGWDFDRLEKENKVSFIYIPGYKSVDIVNRIMDAISSIKAKRAVIDSLSAVGLALEGVSEVRKMVYIIVEGLKKMNCTTILTAEIAGESAMTSTSAGKISRFDIEEFVCDSVITMHYTGLGGAADRAIRVLKMRRTNHAKGPVLMSITSSGITISKKKIF